MDIIPASSEALELFKKPADHIPQITLFKRLRFAACSFFDMTFERDCDIAKGGAVEKEEVFLDDALEMMLAVCLRPNRGAAGGQCNA